MLTRGFTHMNVTLRTCAHGPSYWPFMDQVHRPRSLEALPTVCRVYPVSEHWRPDLYLGTMNCVCS